MADEGKAPEQVPQEDALKNIKAEMERKFKNINDSLAQQNQILKEQLEKLVPKQAPAVTNVKRDWFDTDPEQFATEVLTQAEKIADEKINKEQARVGAFQQILSQHPEMADPESDFFKAATEAHAQLTPALQNTPEGYELAAARARTKVGPRKEMAADDSDFVVSGKGTKKVKRKDSVEVPRETLQFAQAMGINVNDPAEVEKLKARMQRDYSQYGRWGK